MTTLENIYYTPKEVATMLKVSPRTIQRLLKPPVQITYLKIGRQMRISEKELEKYLLRNTTGLPQK